MISNRGLFSQLQLPVGIPKIAVSVGMKAIRKSIVNKTGLDIKYVTRLSEFPVIYIGLSNNFLLDLFVFQ